jgi:hypothetical protein
MATGKDPGSEISVSVYRRLDNRNEGFGDDSPRALELHNRRGVALHDALDGQTNWRVVDWGKTDDTKPHELIELCLEILKSAYFQTFALPVLTYIGGRLLDAAIDKSLVEPTKASDCPSSREAGKKGNPEFRNPIAGRLVDQVLYQRQRCHDLIATPQR